MTNVEAPQSAAAARWVVRVTSVKGGLTHIVGLPEELGSANQALRFTEQGAQRLARELCKAGWTAYFEPLRTGATL